MPNAGEVKNVAANTVYEVVQDEQNDNDGADYRNYYLDQSIEGMDQDQIKEVELCEYEEDGCNVNEEEESGEDYDINPTVYEYGCSNRVTT